MYIYTEQERMELAEEFEKSDMSFTKFAKMHHMSINTIQDFYGQYCIKKRNEEKKQKVKKKKLKFVTKDGLNGAYHWK